jgi:hypothetical protein
MVLRTYADLSGGIRCYFARREGDDWVASFSAEIAPTGFMIINISAIMILVDNLLYGEPRTSRWITGHRGVYLASAGGVAAGHAVFAKADSARAVWVGDVFAGGGVEAGIDDWLAELAELPGDESARGPQLVIGYAPRNFA